MFSTIRRRLRPTPTAAIATLALVFTMTGGAYAANRYLITSTKQIKPSVLAQLKGKSGAAGAAGVQGPQGPQGSQGAKGETGNAGSAGEKGTDGEKGRDGEKGEKGEKGATGVTGATGAAGSSGATGPAGPEGVCSQAGCTLPEGISLKGQWAIYEIGTNHAVSAISFDVPLKTAPVGHFIGFDKELAGEPNESPAIASGECSGSATKPEAAKGNLCVFVATAPVDMTFAGAAGGFINNEAEGSPLGVGLGGTMLNFLVTSTSVEASGRGVWVVTGD
jgi:hypothetical protein